VTVEPARPTSILVVDDTVENLRLLAMMLGQQGFEIRAVTSGKQALQAAEHAVPDLILLDITMPEMDGYEVCARLKQHPVLKHVPVLFLTALNDAADKVKAFELGGVDFITKPFQLEEVVARVKTHLELRRAQVELSSSYERLRSLEQLRDDLVHMIVHDMRSPLTALQWNLELLYGTERANKSDTARELKEALRAVSVLAAMANDLLDVSRLEEGKMPVERTRCDLGEVAAQARASVAGLDSTRPVEIDVAGPVPIDCDRNLVRRVLENLISNGIKHTPSGSGLRVVIRVSDGRVRVAVHDAGQGVPEEVREKLFRKFEAVSVRKDRQYHSAGLGLAFCRLAVEAHGGSIGVEPDPAGGNVFWFELPT
jgi:two-component system, sensor histidine kinase and response regulator